MSNLPELNLSCDWEITKSGQVLFISTELGDDYQQTATTTLENIDEVWSVSASGLTKVEADQILQNLSFFAGAQQFLWTPYPGLIDKGVYTCEEWSLTRQFEHYQISAKLVKDPLNQCITFLGNFDPAQILDVLSKAKTFYQNYSTKATQPFLTNSKALAVDAFHSTFTRGLSQPNSAGKTETLFSLIETFCNLYEVTQDVAYQNYAIALTGFLESIVYGSTVPTTGSAYYPHSAINLKSSAPGKGATASRLDQYGYFDVTVSFTNGVGVIPSGSPNFGERVSDVFRVYSLPSQLSGRHVRSEVIGTEYPINYWVSNVMLQGSNFRVYPTSEKLSGVDITATAQTAGTIVLLSTFTGSLRVSYYAYTNTTIAVEQAFNLTPWDTPSDRISLYSTLNSAYKAYDALFRVTAQTKWRNAKNSTLAALLSIQTLQNSFYWYQVTTSGNPYDLPGVVIRQLNHSNGFTVTRPTTGTYSGKLSLSINSPGVSDVNPQTLFRVAKSPALLSETSQIEIDIVSSVSQLLEVSVSLSEDINDFTQTFTCLRIVDSASTPLTLNLNDFRRWSDALWYSAGSVNPFTLTAGSGATAIATTQQITLTDSGDTLNPVVYNVTLNKAGTSATALLTLQKQTNRPPRIFFKLTGDPLILRIQDAAGVYWDCTIAAQDWLKISYNWANFSYSTINAPATDITPSTGNIQGVQFVATGSSVLSLFWVSIDSFNDPVKLPTNRTVYNPGVISKIRSANIIYIGNFRATNTESSNLQYPPGILPYAVRTNGGTIVSFQGLPYAGFQDPYVWLQSNQGDYLEATLRFLMDSQDAYFRSTGVYGGFAPVHYWNYYPGREYILGTLNTWGWVGSEPNTDWDYYQFKPLESVAKVLWKQPKNQLASLIVSRALGMHDNHFSLTSTNKPLSVYPPGALPNNDLASPYAAAMLGKTAIYANLAGFDEAITIRVLYRCWLYLQAELMQSGTMLGSFSKSQREFTVSSTVYREYFTVWHSEIMDFLGMLTKYRDSLNLPGCDQLTFTAPKKLKSIFWYSASLLQTAKWGFDLSGVTNGIYLPTLVNTDWVPQCTGDANEDGAYDVYWLNSATGNVAVWYFKNNSFSDSDYINTGLGAGTPWRLVGVGDFTGNGGSDLIWRNYSTGQNAIWEMNGLNLVQSYFLPTVIDPTWQIVSVADFNSDGKPDLVWRYASASGGDANKVAIWLLDFDFSLTAGIIIGEIDQEWVCIGSQDLDDDGFPEIIWYNQTKATIRVWKLINVQVVSSTDYKVFSISGWVPKMPF